MTLQLCQASSRFVTRAEGRTTWHGFSFGAHYDPARVGFGALIAHNDERLPPGTGYPDHPHSDTEIVTFVLSGALRHTDSTGVTGVLEPGRVQRMSAGSGVVHSEVCEAGEQTRFIQAWVRPDIPGTVPSYAEASGLGTDALVCLVGPAAVPIGTTGASFHLGRLAAGTSLELPDAERLHVFVTSGQVSIGEALLDPDDAALLVDEGGRSIRSAAGAQVLVWAFTD